MPYDLRAVRWPDQQWREARLRPGFAAKVDASGAIWIAPAHLIDRYGTGDPRLVGMLLAVHDGIVVVGEPLGEEGAKRAEIEWLRATLAAQGGDVILADYDLDGELHMLRSYLSIEKGAR